MASAASCGSETPFTVISASGSSTHPKLHSHALVPHPAAWRGFLSDRDAPPSFPQPLLRRDGNQRALCLGERRESPRCALGRIDPSIEGWRDGVPRILAAFIKGNRRRGARGTCLCNLAHPVGA